MSVAYFVCLVRAGEVLCMLVMGFLLHRWRLNRRSWEVELDLPGTVRVLSRDGNGIDR